MVPRAPQSAPQPPQFMRDGYPSPPAAFRAPGRISALPSPRTRAAAAGGTPPHARQHPAQPVTQDHSGDGPRGPCRWPGAWGVGCCLSCLFNGQIVVHKSQFFSNGAAATPSESGGNLRSRSCRSRRRGSKTQIYGQGFSNSPRSDPSWGASCGRHPGSAPVRQIALGVGPPRGRLLRRAEAARSQMSRPSTWRAV